MKKIAIAYGGSSFNEHLVCKLIRSVESAEFIVIEEDISSWDSLQKHLKMRFRRYGLFKTLDMCILQLFSMFFSKRNLLELEQYEGAKISVNSVNSPKVMELLERERVDLLILLSTGIVSKRVFTVPVQGALNLHPGINPRYRGAGGSFWAMYEENFKLIGFTIHQVTTKIDEGEVYSRRVINTVEPSVDENLQSVFNEGVEDLIMLLRNFSSSGELTPIVDEANKALESKMYGYFGFTDFIKAQRNIKKYLSTKKSA